MKSLLLINSALAVVSVLRAQESNRLTNEEARQGWKLLFDGVSFKGWDDPLKKTPPGNAWVVADGCLKTVPHASLRADLLTTDSYGDFDLAFEWKIAPGGNSGLKYRIQDIALLVIDGTTENKLRFEDRVDFELRNRANRRESLPPAYRIEEYSVAFEYQTIDDKAHPDALKKPVSTSGALYSMIAPSQIAARPAGEFNQSRIRLQGNHVEHWLNGVKVLDADLSSPDIAKALAARWTEKSKVYELLTQQPKKKSPIALQHHEDEAWFRNLKIRPL